MSHQLQETYESFAQRYMRAQNLPKGQKGIIIIGNSRSGKSTLACAAAGAQMSLQYAAGSQVFITPDQYPYTEYVKNCNQSVTETPNFFPAKPGKNIYAIVDMPGHADNSLLRQLINFHYIKTMASNLQKVRFLIVLKIQVSKKNPPYRLEDRQFEMMEAFVKMFPNCNDNLKIIINKLDHDCNPNQVKNFVANAIKESKRSTLVDYFMRLTSKDIYTIERPRYKKSLQGQKIYKENHYRDINAKMQSICNNSKEQDFIALNPQNFNKFNILSDERPGQNKAILLKFQKLLYNFSQTIKQLIVNSSNIIEDLIVLLAQSILQNKQQVYRKIQELISNFILKNKIKTQGNRSLSLKMEDDNILVESTIIQSLSFIKQKHISTDNIATYKQCNDYFNLFYRTVAVVSKKIFNKASLNEKINNICIFLDRRFQQFFFIWNLLKRQNKQQERFREKQNIIQNQLQDIKLRISEMGQFRYVNQQGWRTLIQVHHQYIKIDIHKILNSILIHDYLKLQKQIHKILTIIDKDRAGLVKDLKQIQNLHHQILKKQKEVTIQILLHVQPHQHKLINVFIQHLLNTYDDKLNYQTRLRILFKLARLFERASLQKDAIVLNFHICLNHEVMRLVDHHILRPATSTKQKKQQAQAWLSTLAKQFKQNAQYSFARSCLENAKKLAIDDIELFLKLELESFEYAEQQKMGHCSMGRIHTLCSEEQKYNYWNWVRIGQQIQFQRLKWKINKQLKQSAVKQSDIILRKYRNIQSNQ